MKTLSCTQEYFLCAINDKGNAPGLKSDRVAVCLVVSGIMELLGYGYIAQNEKGKFVAGIPWDDRRPYLKSLYETIVYAKRAKNMKGITSIYVAGVSGKHLNTLLSELGASLYEAGCADIFSSRGLFGSKEKYAPKPEATTRVIEKIRAEFLEEGAMTNETLRLAAFLYKSRLIRDYFSKVEMIMLKKRLTEVRKTEAYHSVKETIDYIDSCSAGMTAVIVSSSVMTSP